MSRSAGSEPKPYVPRLEDYLAVMLGVRSREGFTFARLTESLQEGEVKDTAQGIAVVLDQGWLASATENFEVSPIPDNQVSYDVVERLIVDFYTGLGLEYLQEISKADELYFAINGETELYVTTSIYPYKGSDPDRSELLVTASKDRLWNHHKKVSKRFGKK